MTLCNLIYVCDNLSGKLLSGHNVGACTILSTTRLIFFHVALQHGRNTITADQGDAIAQNKFGDTYETGRCGVERNYAEAAKYFKLSANQGHPVAQYNLAWLYENGRGMKRDYVKTVKYYTLAAEQGNVMAQHKLGEMYENGQGVQRDYAQAAKFYFLAIEQDDRDALYRLVLMCASFHIW